MTLSNVPHAHCTSYTVECSLFTRLCMQVALFVSDHVAAVVFHQGYGTVSQLVKQYCVALIPGMWLLVSDGFAFSQWSAFCTLV